MKYYQCPNQNGFSLYAINNKKEIDFYVDVKNNYSKIQTFFFPEDVWVPKSCVFALELPQYQIEKEVFDKTVTILKKNHRPFLRSEV